MLTRLADLPGLTVSVAATEATIGGGSTPGLTLPSRGLAVEADGRSATALAAALRSGVPPVVGRIAGDRLLLDLRAVDPQSDDLLAAALRSAARGRTVS